MQARISSSAEHQPYLSAFFSEQASSGSGKSLSDLDTSPLDYLMDLVSDGLAKIMTDRVTTDIDMLGFGAFRVGLLAVDTGTIREAYEADGETKQVSP